MAMSSIKQLIKKRCDFKKLPSNHYIPPHCEILV